MFMNKPILVSDATPLKRIIEETNAGVVFKSDDSKDFAEKTQFMLESKLGWGEFGKKAVWQKYNWNNEVKELLRVFDSFNFVTNQN